MLDLCSIKSKEFHTIPIKDSMIDLIGAFLYLIFFGF
jgi:hypothetical protein